MEKEKFIQFEPPKQFYYYGAAKKRNVFGKIINWFKRKFIYKKYKLIGVETTESAEEHIEFMRKWQFDTKNCYVVGIDAYDKDSKGKSFGA